MIDQLVLEIDENPPYEVVNDDRYNKFKTANSIPMIFVIKSQQSGMKDSDMNSLFMRWVGNGHVKFLLSESQAKVKYSGKNEKINEYLRPYSMTDFLQEEIMNLEYKQSGNNIQVKRVSRAIQKDRFSALKYGLWWIYLEEQKNKTRQIESIGDIGRFFMGRGVKKFF